MQKSTTAQILSAFASDPAAKQKASQKEIEMVVGLANDKTNADEALIWTKGILYALTAFVIYLGFNYYLSTFVEMFPYPVAFTFAIALPALIEVGKIRLAARALRSWWFGWINNGLYATAYWGFISLLAIGCYVWSYTISTGGIKEVAKATATEKNKQSSLQDQIKAATVDIDARLANIDASDNDAKGMTTKRGKIAWSGQSIMMKNSDLKASLQKERQDIVTSVAIEHSKYGAETETKINRWSVFVERFGGWGEIGTAICIFICSFFDKRLVLANLDNLAQAKTNPSPTQTAHDPISEFRKNAPNVQNSTGARPIGFFVENPYRDTVPQTAPPVPHLETPVPHPSQHYEAAAEVFGSNQVLTVCSKRLMSDIPNLIQKNGNPETVSERINRALDETLELIYFESFKPNREVAIKFYQYLVEKAFPTLNAVGRPYPKDQEFVRRIYQVIQATEPVTA